MESVLTFEGRFRVRVRVSVRFGAIRFTIGIPSRVEGEASRVKLKLALSQMADTLFRIGLPLFRMSLIAAKSIEDPTSITILGVIRNAQRLESFCIG